MDSLVSVRRRRPAFTLVELLVVIAIIAVLVALILPAVQQAREAARRTQCRNNLKQIGIALNNYVQLRQMYPPGYVYNPSAGAPFLGWSWETMLLPMLDQTPLYEQVSSRLEQGLPTTAWPAPQTALPILRCPSDVGDSLVTNVNGSSLNSAYGQPGSMSSTVGSYGRSNYFAVAGAWNNAGTVTGLNAGGESGIARTATFHGTFGENSSIYPAQMSDGSSHTIVVGERYSPASAAVGSASDSTSGDTDGGCNKGSNSESGTGPVETTTTSATLMATTGDGIWVAATARANSPSDAAITGQAYVLGDTAASGVPATAFRQNGNNGQSRRGLTTGFGSLHSGGAFYLLGDGSVRFINDSIDVALYRDLGTINDGALVGDF